MMVCKVWTDSLNRRLKCWSGNDSISSSAVACFMFLWTCRGHESVLQWYIFSVGHSGSDLLVADKRVAFFVLKKLVFLVLVEMSKKTGNTDCVVSSSKIELQVCLFLPNQLTSPLIQGVFSLLEHLGCTSKWKKHLFVSVFVVLFVSNDLFLWGFDWSRADSVTV